MIVIDGSFGEGGGQIIRTSLALSLVLQAVLPPLMIAAEPSLLTLEGGTHNVHAPPFDFIQKSFLPLVNRTGPTVTVELQRYGFYPPGGGRFNVYVQPSAELARLDLLERGAILSERARALCVNLPA